MGLSLGVSTGCEVSPCPCAVYEEPLQLGRKQLAEWLPFNSLSTFSISFKVYSPPGRLIYINRKGTQSYPAHFSYEWSNFWTHNMAGVYWWEMPDTAMAGVRTGNHLSCGSFCIDFIALCTVFVCCNNVSSSLHSPKWRDCVEKIFLSYSGFDYMRCLLIWVSWLQKQGWREMEWWGKGQRIIEYLHHYKEIYEWKNNTKNNYSLLRWSLELLCNGYITNYNQKR